MVPCEPWPAAGYDILDSKALCISHTFDQLRLRGANDASSLLRAAHGPLDDSDDQEGARAEPGRPRRPGRALAERIEACAADRDRRTATWVVAMPEAEAAFGRAYAKEIHDRNLESHQECWRRSSLQPRDRRSRSSSGVETGSDAPTTWRRSARLAGRPRLGAAIDLPSSRRRRRRGRGSWDATTGPWRSTRTTLRWSASWDMRRISLLYQLIAAPACRRMWSVLFRPLWRPLYMLGSRRVRRHVHCLCLCCTHNSLRAVWGASVMLCPRM